MRRVGLVLLAIFALGCPGSDSDPLGRIGCPPLVVFSPTEVDTRAMVQPATQIAPDYPPDALANDIEGEVLFVATISDQGTICFLLTLREEPAGWDFETAARDAVTQWRYDPARLNGDPVASIENVFVQFTLP